MLINLSAAERLIQTASSVHGISAIILRVGQLCGNTTTGHWNSTEMWPLIFATSFDDEMKAIPMFPKKIVDWVPVDIAGSCISEILTTNNLGVMSRRGVFEVHNIVNPHAVPWEQLIDMLEVANSMNLERTTMADWTRRLKSLSEQDSVTLPGSRLLHYFEGMARDDQTAPILRIFETSKTAEISKSLKNLKPLGQELVMKFVDAWKKEGFLL